MFRRKLGTAYWAGAVIAIISFAAFFIAPALADPSAIPEPPASPDAAADVLAPIIKALTGSDGRAVQLLTLMSFLGSFFKLLFTWVESRRSVDARMEAEMQHLESHPLYRWFAWALDFLFRFKLKTVAPSLPRIGGGAAMLLCGFGMLWLAGCANYSHTRYSDAGQPLERTAANIFLNKTSLENLRTRVTEKRGTNIYTRQVGVDSAESKVDAEGIQALEGLMGHLVMQGLSAYLTGGGSLLAPGGGGAPLALPQLAAPRIVVVTNYVVATNAPAK